MYSKPSSTWKMGADARPVYGAYKAILIVGEEHQIPLNIRELYECQGYLLIGDGSIPLPKLDLSVLEDQVDQEDNEINIWAHGSVENGRHIIDGIPTEVFLERIASYNEGMPLNIRLRACYAGAAAVAGVKALPKGSMLVTHGAEDEGTLININANTIYQSSKDAFFITPGLDQGTRITPVQDLARRFLLNVKQSTTISIKKQDGSTFHHTISPPRGLLTIPDEIIRYFAEQRLEFVKIYNGKFDAAIDIASLPGITEEEALEWREDNLATIINISNKKRLVEALEHGKVGDLLKRINYLVARQPVLIWAASQGYDKVVSALLANDNSIDVNEEYYGKTALMLAIERGHGKVVTTLLGTPGVHMVVQDNGKEKSLSAEELEVLKGASAAAVLAVIKYGLDLAKVKDIACFTPSASKTALICIQRAYEKGLHDADKQAQARQTFESIKDLDNPFCIEAVIKFGLDPKQVEEALCFKPAIGQMVISLLQQVYDQGQSDIDQQASAQRVFESIKDLDNLFHIVAVIEFGLDPKQLKEALCFKPATGETAVKYIQRAYEKGLHDADKQAKAQQIFESIKDLDNLFHIVAVIEFGLDPKQLKEALCFKPATGETAIIYIQKAYEKGLHYAAKQANACQTLESIKDLDNLFQIKAVAEFDLEPKQVKEALCFNSDISYVVVGHIQNAYEKGQFGYDKQAKAQQIFESIKDLDKSGQVEVVVEFGLDSKQVKEALCFNSGAANGAVMYIKNAYEKGQFDYDKRANAYQAFESIKDLDNSSCIMPMVEFGLDIKQAKEALCFKFDDAYRAAVRYLREARSIDEAEVSQVFDIIKDLDNSPHIDAAIVFVRLGLDPKQVKEALCFSQESTTRVAIKLIQDAYNQRQLGIGKQANAQKAFETIKDLDNPYRIEAVIKFGLDPKQVEEALCFNSVAGRMVISLLLQAYDQGQSDIDKQADVQRIFESIKDLDNKFHIGAAIALVKLGLNPRQVKGALCFSQEATARMAIKFIQNAYNQGQSDIDQQGSAQRVFESIKDLDNPAYMKTVSEYALRHNNEQVNNPYHIIATTVFDLYPEQVKEAPCFNVDPGISARALALIHKAYNEGNSSDDKKYNAKKAFAQIQTENLFDVLERNEVFSWHKVASVAPIGISINEVKSVFKERATQIFITYCDTKVLSFAEQLIKELSQNQEEQGTAQAKPQSFQEREDISGKDMEQLGF